MAIVAMRPGGHARCHAIDVKAGAERLAVVELQDAVANGLAILIDEGHIFALANVHHAAIFGFHGSHSKSSSQAVVMRWIAWLRPRLASSWRGSSESIGEQMR